MSVFRSIVFAAFLAGLLVGVLTSVLQFFGTVPLIQQSEAFERTSAAAPVPRPPHAHHDAGKASSSREEWEPAEGFERNAFTLAANILTSIGFGLLLTGIYAVRRHSVSWREGFFWGIAGFIVFTVAPGLGLPPELPGMPVADLTARQTWWVGTAIATAFGLYLISSRAAAWSTLLGLAVIAVPHLIGAPVAPPSGTEVPASLAHRFVVVVTLTSLIFWASLGVATSLAFQRLTRTNS